MNARIARATVTVRSLHSATADAPRALPMDNAPVHIEFVEPDSDVVIGSIDADAIFDGTDIVIHGARSGVLVNVLGTAFRDRWFDVVTPTGRFRNYRAVTDGSTTMRLCHFGASGERDE